MIETQRQKVLRLLRQAGDFGVSSYDFTYKHAVKQAPTRIHELQKLGHGIITKKHDTRSVKYFLIYDAEPVIVKPKYEIITGKNGAPLAKQITMF